MAGVNQIHTPLPAPYHCLKCGKELHWVGDFMRNEVWGLDYDEMDDDDNSVCGFWSCDCGEEYEVMSFSNNELKELEEQMREEHTPYEYS